MPYLEWETQTGLQILAQFQVHMPQQSLCMLAAGSNDHARCPYVCGDDFRGWVLKMNMKQREGRNGQEPTCTTELNLFEIFPLPWRSVRWFVRGVAPGKCFFYCSPFYFEHELVSVLFILVGKLEDLNSMAVAGGIKCLKYLLLAFNAIFWVGLSYISCFILPLCEWVWSASMQVKESVGGRKTTH